MDNIVKRNLKDRKCPTDKDMGNQDSSSQDRCIDEVVLVNIKSINQCSCESHSRCGYCSGEWYLDIGDNIAVDCSVVPCCPVSVGPDYGIDEDDQVLNRSYDDQICCWEVAILPERLERKKCDDDGDEGECWEDDGIDAICVILFWRNSR